MKKVLLASFCAVLIVVFLFLQRIILVGETRTPELLGDAPAIFIRAGRHLIGVTWNDYAGFSIVGENREYSTNINLRQIWGGEIGGYDPSSGIPMRLYFVGFPDWSRARGEIGFRLEISEGNWRKACLRVYPAEFPGQCRFQFP